MKNRMFDFASHAPTPPHPVRPQARPAREWRRALLCLAAAALVATTGACSSTGWIPGLGHDAAVDMPKGSGGMDDALTAARARMQAEPQEPFWPFHLGELYLAADSTALATESLKSALTLDPTYAPAAALLSKIYYDAGMHAEGIALLDDVLTRDPNAPDALRADLALHLEATGDVATAQTVLAGCREDSRDTYTARTFVALSGTDAQSALDLAKRALDADDHDAVNHNNYGVALLLSGKPVEARKAFQKALALDDKLPGAMYNMAIVEAFYFFDEEAGRTWYTQYRQLASADPDDLESILGTDVTRLSGSRPGDKK